VIALERAEVDWSVARCAGAGTDLFYPATTGGPRLAIQRVTAARRVCRECPILVDCRTYAREFELFGIWGGEIREPRWSARLFGHYHYLRAMGGPLLCEGCGDPIVHGETYRVDPKAKTKLCRGCTS